ncbi:LMO1 [Candida oxycetoniae]|uniref:LMO1 n=1 Tax=Candida oxycetoniae TaxID=497107 RepID=A0AAI9SYI8_9ASCO|nr:LMO1 [Candida oxycetoniae]KAI3405478.2 LMO1 [Candida oxycetoniae]
MESSRTINHKLNEILSKNNINKAKLDESSALSYANVLKTNILGKDKQEKVNSIVVLAKLLDCIAGGGGANAGGANAGGANGANGANGAGGANVISDSYGQILNHELFRTLLSIISINMSSETYKAILKIAVITISGAVFETESLAHFLPLYESLIGFLDAIDIIATKLYLPDNKIILNSIKLVTDLINQAVKFDYSGIITIAARLKHAQFFSTIDNMMNINEEKVFVETIDHLRASYRKLNQYLNSISFDLSIKSHQLLLNNLFIFLEVSLNEFGTQATTKEYIKSGFTDNPRQYIVDNFSILLAMDLKIFLKNPNFTFKKRFHEELMMSNHMRTFPLALFIERCSKMWIKILDTNSKFPVLSYELLIYSSMNICLNLWQETKAQSNNKSDIDKIFQLLLSNIESFEVNLDRGMSIEECLDITSSKSSDEMRHIQANKISENFTTKWQSRLSVFNEELRKQVWKFVAEQRVIQLLKGSWVFTEKFGESLFNPRVRADPKSKYYYIILSPNRKFIYFKQYAEKPSFSPSFEELEEAGGVKLTDIYDVNSTVIGEALGEEDKKKYSMLISIKGTISYEKLTIVGANQKRLLSFYTDSEVNRFVWLDGIKMLKDIKTLSDDTVKQINSLMYTRRNTQLLGLDSDIDSDKEEEEEEKFSSEELDAVTTDFYYI